MTTTILILQIIIGLVSGYLLFFAQQKGKNLADKQDLKKITEIVEEVKKKNIEEVELLKANLLLFADKEKQIYSEEKEAIVVFFAQLNTWIWDSLNFYMHEFNISNYQEIYKRQIAMRDAYNKTNITYSKVKLIVNDETLVKLGNDAILKTLDLHHFKENLLSKLSYALSSEKSLVDQFLNKQVDYNNIDSEMKKFYKDQSEYNQKEIKNAIDENFAESSSKFNPAMIAVNEFKTLAKKYLRN